MNTNCIFNLKSETLSISSRALIERPPWRHSKVMKVLFEPIPEMLQNAGENFEVLFECNLKSEEIDFIFKIENVKIIDVKPSTVKDRFLIIFSFEEYTDIMFKKEPIVIKTEPETYLPKKVKVRKNKLHASP